MTYEPYRREAHKVERPRAIRRAPRATSAHRPLVHRALDGAVEFLLGLRPASGERRDVPAARATGGGDLALEARERELQALDLELRRRRVAHARVADRDLAHEVQQRVVVG